MEWVYLILAIAAELCGTFCFKLSSVSGQPIYFLGVAIGYGVAIAAFQLCLKAIDISVAYAVWSGIGIVGTSLLGVLFFDENLSGRKPLYIALILVSVIGLNLSDHR
ncbi:MAG TPA: multidrug efflux SMR transporter [Thermosynechococcaceae cyanobacterium]